MARSFRAVRSWFLDGKPGFVVQGIPQCPGGRGPMHRSGQRHEAVEAEIPTIQVLDDQPVAMAEIDDDIVALLPDIEAVEIAGGPDMARGDDVEPVLEADNDVPAIALAEAKLVRAPAAGQIVAAAPALEDVAAIAAI